MPQAMPFRARITGTGGYAPPHVFTNDDMAKVVDTNDEWIRTRTGIVTRQRVAYEGEMSTADMAEHAAKKAIEAAGISADEIDMIIVGTVTPDYRCPSTAAILQHKLGAYGACGFDVGAACAGSMHAMAVAERFVVSGAYKKILVVGAETLSIITNWTDRSTCVLFGDAAAAVVLEPGPLDGPGFLDHRLYLDGRLWEAIHQPAGGSRQPVTAELLAEHKDRLFMNGREVYKYAVRALPKAAEEILSANGLSTDDVKWVVAHQANMRIIEAVADRLNLPLDRWIINIDRYGNTSSASTLMTYDEGVRDGRIQPGDLVLMMSIGAGLTWASALYRA